MNQPRPSRKNGVHVGVGENDIQVLQGGVLAADHVNRIEKRDQGARKHEPPDPNLPVAGQRTIFSVIP